MKAIFTLQKRDTLAKPACPITNAAVASLEDFVRRSLSSLAMPGDEKVWTIGNFVDTEADKRVGFMRRSRDLGGLCCAKKGKAPESVPVANGLAVKLFDEAAVPSSPGAGNVADPCKDGLMEQLARTGAEVILLTTKLFDYEETCDKAAKKHEDLLMKLLTEKKTSEEHIVAERDGDLLLYHGVLRSIQGVVKAADERDAGFNDTLTYLRLFSERGAK